MDQPDTSTDDDAFRTYMFMDNSILATNDIIPIIFTKTGQFTVIDGFVIHLKTRPELVNDLESKQAKQLLNPGGWFMLRNIYNPDSYKTIEFINSNFYISKNEILFNIIKSSVIYVKFTEKSGYFRCKRTSRQDATHQAIQLRIERGDRTVLKYLVDMKTLKPPKFDPNDLLAQQSVDITIMKSVINEAVRTIHDNNPSLQNFKHLKGFETPEVYFAPKTIISKIKRYPISTNNIKVLFQKEETHKTSQLNQLRDELFSIMNKHNTTKLTKLKEYFANNPTDFNIDANIVGEICQKCLDNCRVSLNSLSTNLFPQLIKRWLQTTTSKEDEGRDVSESYCIIDRFLVSKEDKCIVDDKDENFLSSISMAERSTLRRVDLIDWNMLKLISNPLVSESKKLFELVKHNYLEFIEDDNGFIWNSSDDMKGTKKTFKTISIDCGDFGWKHILLKDPDSSTDVGPSKTETFTKMFIDGQFRNHDFNNASKQLIKDIYEFTSYSKQRSIYTKLFEEVIQLFQKSQLG